MPCRIFLLKTQPLHYGDFRAQGTAFPLQVTPHSIFQQKNARPHWRGLCKPSLNVDGYNCFPDLHVCQVAYRTCLEYG